MGIPPSDIDELLRYYGGPAHHEELAALRQRASDLEAALRSWMSTCECHGTGTITRCISASTDKPLEMVTRQCFADFCKASRAALLRAVKGG